MWGNQASVLVGDYLLGQAFRIMVTTGSLAALKVLADAAAVIAEGFLGDLADAADGTDDARGFERHEEDLLVPRFGEVAKTAALRAQQFNQSDLAARDKIVESKV